MSDKRKEILHNLILLSIVILSGIFMYIVKPNDNIHKKSAGCNETFHTEQQNTSIKTFR